MAKARISGTLGTILLHTIAVTLCFTLAGNTAAAEQIDQSNLPEWAGGWTHLNPAAEDRAAMWQTFTPARPNLTAVEIDVLTISPGRGDDTLTVEISKDENILASAERYVEDGFDGLLRFEFLEAVPLVPEQIYELKVRDTGITRFGWKYSSNSYERGSRYVLAQESPNSDWLFQTYSQVEPTVTKYSGGTGEPNDPYQIATAEDLIALGNEPNDYDKHFILTADIDLDPNLPGGKVFDKAIIGWDASFVGVFDGMDHIVRNLDMNAHKGDYVGLFGRVGLGGKIQNLGTTDVKITGVQYVGGFVGVNFGVLSDCWSTGTVTGTGTCIGGLVGMNSYGIVARSYSTVNVSGRAEGGIPIYVGGLVGYNNRGAVSNCYSTGSVSEIDEELYSATAAGGLIGFDEDGAVTSCYSVGNVNGPGLYVGGLLGSVSSGSIVITSFWDITASDQTTSADGVGKTTAEMMDANTFISAGWDFVGETANGTDDIWKIVEGQTYPLLSWQKYGGGTGEPNDPYLLYTTEHLNDLGAEPNDYDKHFKLMADIDLSGYVYDRAVIAPDTNDLDGGFQGIPFTGVFDGKDHTISHLTINGKQYLGLFGQTDYGANISNLGLEAVDVNGTSGFVGGLIGWNGDGNITACYSTGSVSGEGSVGGLVGGNGYSNSITNCHSTGSVSGRESEVGGLVGSNYGIITLCYSTGYVSGNNNIGGLVGNNTDGSITSCYSAGTVTGNDSVGGLVGVNETGAINKSYSTGAVNGEHWVGGLLGGMVETGWIWSCYSTGSVSGNDSVGGLVGYNPWDDSVMSSFWDVDTSGKTASAGGSGKTTAEMQMQSTFTDSGWDFVDEIVNGTEDIWWIDEGQDYPRLWWEQNPE